MFREKSSLLTTSSTAPRPDAAPSSPGGGSLARKRVMIVEDEALIALDLERRLARLGFEVAGVADNLEDAVALYTSTLPDLVLMDIFIRGPADGIDTARAIGKLGDPLVLFLTAYADEDTVRRAAETSPYGYLLKPFDERTLSATITVALERYATDTRTRLLRAAVESASIGILLCEASGDDRKVVFVNDAFAAMAGAPREALLALAPCMLAANDTDDGVVRMRAALMERTAADAVVAARRLSGEPLWLSVAISPVLNRASQITHLLMFHKDVTRERIAEGALAESQRMELTGRLTAGIAHDFNNVLGAISAFADLARDGLEDPVRKADLDEVVLATRRGEMLTRKLLDFSRRNELSENSSVDLATVILETRAMCERLAGPRVKVEVRVEPTQMLVRADSTSLEQILLNLVANARDAMPTGGQILIAASRPEVASGALEAHRFVRLEVTDTGSGMSPEIARRIFEPLFTTKPRGVGTGLGLTTSKMLIERSGGTVTVQSTIGRGTAFVIELPLTDKAAAQIASVAPLPITGNADGAICLLVEDEAPLRRACARALSDVGFKVVEAASGEAAVRELDTLGNTLSLIVCDMVLPGMGGGDVLAHAARVTPHAAKLIVTGYFDGSETGFEPGIEVLWKPFTTGTLARRALDTIEAARVAPSRSARPGADPTSRRPRTDLRPTPASTVPVSRPKVLLVEDDEQLRRGFAALLTGRGLQVIEAATGAEAIALAADNEVQLALVDVNLPDANGITVLAAIRKRDTFVPILMMTGDPTIETAQKALRGHATSYLTKPIISSVLIEEVERSIAEGQVARLQQKLLISKAGESAMLLDLPATARHFDEALTMLSVAYQPIVRAHDQSLFAYEALMRCKSKHLPGPPQLLAAADALGRMEELGRAIRASVAATLRENPQRDEVIFVNLHPMELRSDLLLAADEPLLPFASRVVLEVTERAQLGSTQNLGSTLEELRGAGYRLALDDLGEGYAGLSWLVKLSPEVAKLDMSLVRDIHTSRIKRELVSSMVGVCRRSHTSVVAEGVETAEEARVLVDLGCDLLQGYFFARPQPPFVTVTPQSIG